MPIPSFVPWVIVALGMALTLWLSFRGERPYEALLGANLCYSGGMLWGLTAWEGAARVGVMGFFALATVVNTVMLRKHARAWSQQHDQTGR